MGCTLVRAPAEALDVVREVAREHHPALLTVGLHVLFRLGKWRSRGKDVWGKAERLSGPAAYFAQAALTDPESATDEAAFLLTISESAWASLEDGGRRALVDHELSHCQVAMEDGVAELSLVPHDVEEFQGVIERHGLWRREVEEFVRAGGQLALPLGEAAREPMAPIEGATVSAADRAGPGRMRERVVRDAGFREVTGRDRR